jgi:hypothetical protein
VATGTSSTTLTKLVNWAMLKRVELADRPGRPDAGADAPAVLERDRRPVDAELVGALLGGEQQGVGEQVAEVRLLRAHARHDLPRPSRRCRGCR